MRTQEQLNREATDLVLGWWKDLGLTMSDEDANKVTAATVNGVAAILRAIEEAR